jgi:hypothetical protein
MTAIQGLRWQQGGQAAYMSTIRGAPSEEHHQRSTIRGAPSEEHHQRSKGLQLIKRLLRSWSQSDKEQVAVLLAQTASSTIRRVPAVRRPGTDKCPKGFSRDASATCLTPLSSPVSAVPAKPWRVQQVSPDSCHWWPPADTSGPLYLHVG